MSELLAIQATDLTRRFGDFTAVDQLNFDVKQGEIFGFLGANGAGKTTAIKMMCGLLKPTEGDALVAGFSARNESEKIKKKIGYMSQKFSLYNDLTVQENIRFFAGIYGLKQQQIKERTEVMIAQLGIAELRDKLVKDLPLGQKQKLAFSTALVHNPKIVFLDEPTSGVDPITRRQFWELIYQAADQGVTILMTTHYLDEAEYCDRISVMVNGRMDAYDTPIRVKEKLGVQTMDEVFLKLTRTA